MRQRLHIMMGVLLALGSAGCGELENAPFRIGTVHGQLTESEPAVALVAVMGAPELRGAVARDGTFTLEQVPAGDAELFIIASASKALRVPLVVQGGQSISLGKLTPREASFLSVRVKAPSHQPVEGARVSLVGTPVEPVHPDKGGRLRMGPLPDGCYALSISLTGFPEVLSETCASAGESKEVKVNLPAPTSACGETGCEEGFFCQPDGRCVECTEDAHCGPGLKCHDSRCEGDGPACAPCKGDWQCHSNASCQELPEGVAACVEACSAPKDCDDGLTCQEGRCLPDPARYSGCQAYRGVGAACASDAACQSLGLINGLCLGGTCTVRCDTDGECPESFSCEEDTGALVCTSRP